VWHRAFKYKRSHTLQLSDTQVSHENRRQLERYRGNYNDNIKRTLNKSGVWVNVEKTIISDISL
jgi:hypothetical protein